MPAGAEGTRHQRNAGLRIDHLLLNGELTPALTAAGVDAWVRGEEGASDHAPTWVELDLSKVGSNKRSTKSFASKLATRKVAARKPPRS